MARKSQRPQPASGSLVRRARSRITGQPVQRQPTRRVPRYQVQARRERMLRRGMIGLLIAVVVILGGAFAWTNLILPRQVVATVNGTGITREDYWKARAIDLWNQGAQLQQFATMVDANLAPQYQEMARQAVSQIPDVWGSTAVDNATLSQMVDDQIYLQQLAPEGLAFAPGEVETYMLNQFADPSAPLFPASATASAAALLGSPPATPLAASPVAGTPAAGLALASPGATPVAGVPATPAASPAAASPTALPMATPLPVAADEARRIAEANFGRLNESPDSFFQIAHLTREDYARLAAAPALAREKIEAKIRAGVGQSAEQVHARHILVATKDLADSLAQELANGADFATLARENSIDAATAPNGGDLGWFAREELPALSETAFALRPNEISAPVQTEFGWHLVQSLGREADRALSDAQITRIGQERVSDWLAARRAEATISAPLTPTPTPAAAEFAPPAGAPPLPTPTPAPAATPVASPVAATPLAASLPATPIGTPPATP